MNTSNFQVEVDSDTLEDENLKDFEYKTMIKFNDEKLCIDSSDNKEDMVKSREKALEHKRNANLLFKRKKFNEAVVQYKRVLDIFKSTVNRTTRLVFLR